MGLFTPGWLKDINKAKAKEKETDSLDVLKRLVMETAFYDKDGLKLIRSAIYHIKRFDPSEEKLSVMRDIAYNAPSPFARCMSAHLLRSDEGRKLVAENIVAAYKVQGDIYIDGTDEWMGDISEASLLREAFSAASEIQLKKNIVRQLRDQELLMDIILKGKDESLAELAAKNLYFKQDQCVRIINECRNETYRVKAIKALDKSNEDLLIFLAQGGNKYAKSRLLELDTAKYARKYMELLEPAQKVIAIENDVFTEEELEKLAKECDDIDERNSGGKPAWAAIRKLQDNRALARLLYRDIPRGSFKNNAYGQPDQEESLWIKWTCAILERMDGNEKDMVKFIVSGHGGHQIRSETIAFKKIKSTEGLLKVALSKNSVALDAAKLLGDEFIDKLRESEDNKVRGYADSKWVDRTISNASETEAFEVMRIKMKQKNDPLNFLRAYESLKSDETRLLAYKEFTKDYLPFGQSSTMVRERMLGAITDGELFLEYCMKGNSHDLDRKRLHELIDGSELEKKMIDAAVDMLMNDPFNGWRHMKFVGTYYGISHYMAAWKYAGKPYIEKLLTIIENDHDFNKADYAFYHLKEIYKNAPESHETMTHAAGRSYVKHDDFVDEQCGANTRNRDVTITISF